MNFDIIGYKDKHESFDKNGVSSIVYLMDCNDFMSQIPDNFYNISCVDPPYGIGMDGGNVGYKGFNNLTKKEWDSDIPESEYFRQLFRISNNQIIWGGNYFGLPATRCFIVWDKGEGFENRTYAECELAWTSFNRNTVKYKRDPLAKGDYKNKIHPTQKPVKLYEWLLMNYANEGDKIFDSHLGSGSSRIASYNLGYYFTGIELDKEYFDASVKRFDNHKKQLTLF